MGETDRHFSRRKLLALGAAGGVGFAAASAAGGFFAARERYAPDTQNGAIKPKELSLPPFDINDFITGSDWNSISALINAENSIYLKGMASVINQQKAQELLPDESGWQQGISHLTQLVDVKDWLYVIPNAAHMQIASPDRADQIYAIINKNYGNMQDSINNIVNHFGDAWYLPDRLFDFNTILYPDADVPVDEWVWNTFSRETNNWYEVPYLWTGDPKLLIPSLAKLKHSAKDKLPPYYFDERFRMVVREHSVNSLESERTRTPSSDNPLNHWIGFIRTAYNSRLLEASSVQMTQGGLVLA